jgi:hypothetical protein
LATAPAAAPLTSRKPLLQEGALALLSSLKYSVLVAERLLMLPYSDLSATR